jgi:hypothetical protein
MDGFLSQLIRNLNADTARAAAQGLNGNPTLVEYLLRNLDGAATAEQMNANADWTIALLQNLDPAALADAVNGALSTAGGKAFVTSLLQNLDGAMVGRGLSQNPQLTEELLKRAGGWDPDGPGPETPIHLGTTLKDLLKDADAGGPSGFLTTLLTALDPDVIIRVINNAAGIRNSKGDINDPNNHGPYYDDPRLKYRPFPSWS